MTLYDRIPHKNIINIFKMLQIPKPDRVAFYLINITNKKTYTEAFENDDKVKQTGGGKPITIYQSGYTFDIHNVHTNTFACYSVHKHNNDSNPECIYIEINKKTQVAYLQNMEFDTACFKEIENGNEIKSGTILLKVCLQIIDTIKAKYKLKYIWLKDLAIKQYKNMEIHICDYSMATSGDTWYGKYGFVPFSKKHITQDKKNTKRYMFNKNIFLTTLVKNTNIKKYIIESALKYNLINKKNIQVFDMYDDKPLFKLFKDLFKHYKSYYIIFNEIYEKIENDLNLEDLYEMNYFMKL